MNLMGLKDELLSLPGVESVVIASESEDLYHVSLKVIANDVESVWNLVEGRVDAFETTLRRDSGKPWSIDLVYPYP